MTIKQTIRAAEQLGFEAAHPNLRSPHGPKTVAIACPFSRVSEARGLLEDRGQMVTHPEVIRDVWQPHFTVPLDNLTLIVGSPLRRRG